jgi:hypothetical protein
MEIEVIVNNDTSYLFDLNSYDEVFALRLSNTASEDIFDSSWTTINVFTDNVINITVDPDIDNTIYIEYWETDTINRNSEFYLIPATMPIKQITGITLSDVVNTNSLTTFLSVVIAGNTIDDGDLLHLQFYSELKNSSGVGQVMTRKAYINSDNSNTVQTTWTNNANVCYSFNDLYLFRLGSDLYFCWNLSGSSSPSSTYNQFLPIVWMNTGVLPFGIVGGKIYSTFDFTSDLTFELKAQFTNANANLWLKPKLSYFYKYPKCN